MIQDTAYHRESIKIQHQPLTGKASKGLQPSQSLPTVNHKFITHNKVVVFLFS